jgi:CheY-like chemotaxis protein
MADAEMNKILIADDYAPLRRGVSDRAKFEGFAPEEASSADEALTLISPLFFAVWTDGFHGRYAEVVAAAKAAGIKHILVVSSDTNLEENAKKLGATFYPKGSSSVKDIIQSLKS